MLTLGFEGWAECRLATDPDPSDEGRGVSGWTFAVAGEPDLDRIIRLQPDHAVARVPGPAVGVTVRSVGASAAGVADHPLVGAAIDLLEDPVFEGRNGIAAEDAVEPVAPFSLAVRGTGGVLLLREHRDLETGEYRQDPPVGFGVPDGELALATGGLAPDEFRAARRAALEELRERSDDEVDRVALDKRIRDIDEGAGGIAEAILGFALRYRIVMQGPWGEVRDPDGVLGGTVDLGPWIASFWFGAFDADALCFYVKGRLELPFQPGRATS
jgi:hypothetical protein